MKSDIRLYSDKMTVILKLQQIPQELQMENLGFWWDNLYFPFAGCYKVFFCQARYTQTLIHKSTTWMCFMAKQATVSLILNMLDFFNINI